MGGERSLGDILHAIARSESMVPDPAKWWASTPVAWVGGINDLWIDSTIVSDSCIARTIHAAIGEHGAARRYGWLITTVDRLFAALPQAVAS